MFAFIQRTTKAEALFFILGLVALLPSVWMTVHRHEGFNVKYRSYDELQRSPDQPVLRALEFDGQNELTVDIASTAPESVQQIPLQRGVEHHNNNGFSISTLFSGDSLVINNSSYAITSRAPFELKDFVIGATSGDQTLRAASEVVLKEMALGDNDSTIEKIGKIAAYLHHQLTPHRGQPAPHMRRLNGYEQYLEATAGRSEVYCANHAEIFAYFATLAGVPTRLVDVGGKFDGLSLAEHAFAESFDAELQSWIYVDLQLHIAYITDARGNPLNGIDVLLHHANIATGNLQANVIKDGSLKSIAYDTVSKQNRLFLPAEATLTYLWGTPDRFSPLNRLHRLFVNPQPGFSLRASGQGTFWRLFLSYLTALCFVCWAMLLLKRAWLRGA